MCAKDSFTRLTLESSGGTISIEIPECGLTIGAVESLLLRPLLLAAGYQPDTVEGLFREEAF